jgi:hypothetical protein
MVGLAYILLFCRRLPPQHAAGSGVLALAMKALRICVCITQAFEPWGLENGDYSLRHCRGVFDDGEG